MTKYLTLEEQAVMVDELLAIARNAILDCRTPPVPNWVWKLEDGQARQLLQNIAFKAATAQLGLDHAQDLLRGWQT